MPQLKTAQWKLLSLPVVYVVIAWGYWGINRQEFYPFAPWSMFNNVPNQVTRYVVYVERPAGENLPVWDCLPEGIKAMPVSVYRAQQALGQAVERKQLQRAIAARNTLIVFLQDKLQAGKCTLVREVFDPREMLLNKQLLERKELISINF